VVSAGVSFDGKESLHFVDEKAKVNADYYANQLLTKSLDDCHQLLGQRFIFQYAASESAVACSLLSRLY